VRTLARLCFGHVVVLLGLLQAGCSESSTSKVAQSSTPKAKVDCSSLEPDNPYDDESGHDAGYKWAAEHDAESCSGNSSSFEEGCEEYVRQVAAFQACENKR
jgi:hypothetical protein